LHEEDPGWVVALGAENDREKEKVKRGFSPRKGAEDCGVGRALLMNAKGKNEDQDETSSCRVRWENQLVRFANKGSVK